MTMQFFTVMSVLLCCFYKYQADNVFYEYITLTTLIVHMQITVENIDYYFDMIQM